MLVICRNRDTKVIARHGSTEAISKMAVRLPRPDFSGLAMTRRERLAMTGKEGLRMTRGEGAAMTDKIMSGCMWLTNDDFGSSG